MLSFGLFGILDSDHAVFVAIDEVRVRGQSETSFSAFCLEPVSKAIRKIMLKTE